VTSARAGLEDASWESDAEGSFLDALRTGVNGGDDTDNVSDVSGDGEGGGELMDGEGRVSGLGGRVTSDKTRPRGRNREPSGVCLANLRSFSHDSPYFTWFSKGVRHDIVLHNISVRSSGNQLGILGYPIFEPLPLPIHERTTPFCLSCQLAFPPNL